MPCGPSYSAETVSFRPLRGFMTTNGRFSQAPPDRANDLFDKLLATSDSAVKTRERVFAELKQELELLASLQ